MVCYVWGISTAVYTTYELRGDGDDKFIDFLGLTIFMRCYNFSTIIGYYDNRLLDFVSHFDGKLNGIHWVTKIYRNYEQWKSQGSK